MPPPVPASAFPPASRAAWRWLLPGLLAALVFVVFPMLYTVGLSLTNTSSVNLLGRSQAREALLAQSRLDEASRLPLSLWSVTAPDGQPARIQLQAGPYRSSPLQWAELGRLPIELVLDASASPGATATATAAATTTATTTTATTTTSRQPLALKEVVARLPELRAMVLRTPEGRELKLVSLREVGAFEPSYRLAGPNGQHPEQPAGLDTLVDTDTGTPYTANKQTGFFTSPTGQRLMPGFRVGVGLQHYQALIGEDRFREPFVAVLGWTLAFAALSVLLSAALGLALAALLDWEDLGGRHLYRTVLFLPYAVPGFISILIFKGLFNPNLGEINALLDALFGWRPAWFSDTTLARCMLLTVNVWLGFPYMMLLCSGLLKAIPGDLYEASALSGAGPWDNLRRITAPLVLRPLLPLLIAAFAFNFNNFVLVSLLTGGRPDQLDSALPVGTTDILVSYTWRIAFQDSGQQLGLAAAISTVIFLIVAAVTLLQLRFTQLEPGAKR